LGGVPEGNPGLPLEEPGGEKSDMESHTGTCWQVPLLHWVCQTHVAKAWLNPNVIKNKNTATHEIFDIRMRSPTAYCSCAIRFIL